MTGPASIEAAVDELGGGRMLVVCDDQDEAGGHLAVAAEHVSHQALTFMASSALGTARLALPSERYAALGLQAVAVTDRHVRRPSFTVAVDARDAAMAPTSVAGRAHTIRVAIAPQTRPGDLLQGGHVLTVSTHSAGVLGRRAAPEASVDLARLAGLAPAAVICDINDLDGRPLSAGQLREFGQRHGLRTVRIDDVVECRRTSDLVVERVVATELPTRFGCFTAIGYRTPDDGAHYLALVKADVTGPVSPLVSLHAQCLYGHALGSLLCPCGAELDRAMEEIEREGRGVLIYLPEPERDIAVGILADLGAGSARLREVSGGCGGVVSSAAR